MKWPNIFLLALILLAASSYSGTKHSGDWLERVPAEERTRPNPLLNDPAVIGAGEHLFARHCASCHGTDANGSRRRPSLRTDRVKQATDGELQWLLRNGSLAHGMPSWSSLPEIQRWQLVRYLHSLPLEERKPQ
jgi:mono/diheme cytochrome c family protein